MNKNENLARVAIKKSLLKEYSNSQNDRVVYLNDGEEFQMQFFNPYSYTIAIKISLNGMPLSNMLVLKPGERIWLDRYLDDDRKFLFNTYEVENSYEANKAIANNGNVTLKFYKELISHNWFVSDSYIYNDHAWDNLKLTQFTTTCNYVDNNDLTCTAANYCNNASVSVGTGSLMASAADTIETGRIEKGSHSNQNFSNVYMDFESFPFKTEYIKLLPKSQKPTYSSDITKKYCHNCGRKLNTKYKFCPFCGKKQ